jgi:phosphohistidine phosphatase SixA
MSVFQEGMRLMKTIVAALAIATLAVLPVEATEAAWAKLGRGGYAVLMLHAIAPGTGMRSAEDAKGCSARRNLSDRGEQQAFRMGARIEARAIPIERVLTSQYCESVDTARLAFGNVPTEHIAALNPLPADEDAANSQIKEIIDRINAFQGPGDLFVVTHKNVILALTGIRPRATEAIIVEPGGDRLRIVARLIVN